MTPVFYFIGLSIIALLIIDGIIHSWNAKGINVSARFGQIFAVTMGLGAMVLVISFIFACIVKLVQWIA